MDRTVARQDPLSPSSHDLFSLFTQKEREFWVSLPLHIRTLPIVLRPHHLASHAREARRPQAAGGNEWQAVDLFSDILFLPL